MWSGSMSGCDLSTDMMLLSDGVTSKHKLLLNVTSLIKYTTATLAERGPPEFPLKVSKICFQHREKQSIR